MPLTGRAFQRSGFPGRVIALDMIRSLFARDEPGIDLATVA